MSQDANPTEGAAAGAVGAPKQTSLLRSSALMASGTLVSRVLGFVRAALLVAAIGGAAGSVSTAFQVANTLPNTIYNLLAAGVFDAVLVPQIVRGLKRKSGDVYVNRLITLAGTILFAVTMVALVIAPLLVTILAGSISGELRHLTVAFSLICLPQIFFYGLYNLLGELLNARGVFGPYMWAPVVNNIVAIAGLVVFLAMYGGAGADSTLPVSEFGDAQFWLLGITATLGVICQALVLIVPMRRAGVRLRPDFHFRGTSFGSASKVAGWTFATLGISQLGVISTSQLATRVDHFADANGVAAMAGLTSYTTMFMIYMVPQSLISVSLATAIFTRLANAAADRDHRAVADQYTTGLNLITMLSLLSAAILMAGATPMVQLVLPTTTNPDVIHAYALVLTALMPGVASTGMVLMSQRVFFAYENAKPVFLMGIVPTALQIVVGWSIYFLSSAQWWTFGASLAETICRLTQGFIAVFWVARLNAFVNPGRIIATYLKYLAAAVASWAVAYVLIRLVGPMTLVESGSLRFALSALKLVLVAAVGALVYLLVLRAIDPASSGAALGYVARRFRMPARLAALLTGSSAGAPASAAAAASAAVSPSAGGADGPLEPPPAPPTSEEQRESAAASRTGWSMIARQWSASDPSHTGEFPIVRPAAPLEPGDPLMRVPSFDEILHPSSGDASPGLPPAPGEPFDQEAGRAAGGEDAIDEDQGEPARGPLPEETSPDGDRPEADEGEPPAGTTEAGALPDTALHSDEGPDGWSTLGQAGTPSAAPDVTETAWSTPDQDAATQPAPDETGAAWPTPDVTETAWPTPSAPQTSDRDASSDEAAVAGPAVPPAPVGGASGAAGAGTAAGAALSAAAVSVRDSVTSWITARREDLQERRDRRAAATADAAADTRASESPRFDAAGAPDGSRYGAPDSTPTGTTGIPEGAWDAEGNPTWDDTPRPAAPGGPTAPPEPPSSGGNGHDRHGDGAGPRRPGDGRVRLDPTAPALTLAALLVVVGAVWGVHQALAPITAVDDLAQSLSAGLAGAQSGDAQNQQSGDASGQGGEPAPQPTVAPVIQAATVFSWNSDSGDTGDHPDLAINLIDGDPSTQWYSRYYDNLFTDDNTVTILLSLEQQSTLSGITLSMDPATSGGELVVRAVPDPAQPRVGTELATTALSPTTEISLNPPAELQYVSLSFRTMPVDSQGLNRAWINEITVH